MQFKFQETAHPWKNKSSLIMLIAQEEYNNGYMIIYVIDASLSSCQF